MSSRLSQLPAGNANGALLYAVDGGVSSQVTGGAANGVAILDAGGKVPVAQTPVEIWSYQGAWDASTNTPTLADGTGTAGDAYVASVAGSQDLGSGSIAFNVGDAVVYDGATWDQIPHGGQFFVTVGGNSAASPLEIGTTTEQPLHLITNGVKKVVVTSIGNVGIAVDNPMAPLHVGGGMFLEAGSVEYEVNLSTGTVTTIGNLTNHNLEIITGNTTRLTVGSNGQLIAAAGYTPSGAKSLAPKDYVDGAVFSGAYGDLTGTPISITSGNVQLELDGEELVWPVDIETGKIRLFNTTPSSDNTFYGFGIANGVLIYQVDSDDSSHVFQGVDGSDNAIELLRMSSSGGVVSSVDLHMSEQKVINVGDPDAARDAVNLQTLNGRLSDAQRTAIDALTPIASPSTASTEDVANAVNGIIGALQAT